MKIKCVCFKFSKVFFLISCIFLILTTSFIVQIIKKSKENKFQAPLINENTNTTTIIEKDIHSSTNQVDIQIEKKSRIIPEKLKGFEIIGKIKIPKLNIEKYILSNTSTKSLKVSVTKVCGPEINRIGNFCIAGHNYNKIFGKIKTLKIHDQIILTDIYGDSTIYEIYDIYKTSPKDISCLNQETNSEKEITLITCTAGATKRVIVKAVEVYD